ncbi:unnamed protein product [Cyprideis torosa]|uniref:PHD finger protein rhinoceros n=1 Tax=Cyprideis torosa TaxID=163714 RepID=A0A7R8W9D1_9CRUS|nr:unnamed protein product [Cyprideis torosa]CAG0889633.1 unnamed protein product [Cyprideis torosa]
MSSRLKRPPAKGGDRGGGTKRKRQRIGPASGSGDEGDGGSLASRALSKSSGGTPKHHGGGRGGNSEAPAELFRKDLISAMKLADNEPLTEDDFYLVRDQWKQEWERGVQVPVQPDLLPAPSVKFAPLSPEHGSTSRAASTHVLRLPKSRYLTAPSASFLASRGYSLDDIDVQWLHIFNAERIKMGMKPLSERVLESAVEEFERQALKLRKEHEGKGLEYDENVVCDICRSPDSEEGNEMVFCDLCNICVHQACYGIQTIPRDAWLCRTCSLGIKSPSCVLCPNKGGAMKSTRSGSKWAHVSCALWIPEVSIGCVERMEPITKISAIPQSRWALVCSLCRDRSGACIQCSVKACKNAYHVTCAFANSLEMKALVEDSVKLKSYCSKHSMTKTLANGIDAPVPSSTLPRKKRGEGKSNVSSSKWRDLEATFMSISGNSSSLQTEGNGSD